MTSGAILDIARDGIVVFLKVGGPLMVIALAVGLIVSLIQALTQIQEQTLSFAVKLIAVMATLALTAGWVGSELYNYTVMVMDAIPRLGR